MARYLGANTVLKSPRTTRTYTITGAETWDEHSGKLRPPAHIIGVGGFGVTYRAVDDRGAAFAMKEYFPRDHAQRGANGVIAPKRSEGGLSKRIYDEGLRRFIAEGHLLTAFNHPSICRVVDAFDSSGTSYQLMRLVEGREVLGESDTGAMTIERRVTLEDYLRELERPDSGAVIDFDLLAPILRQLLDAVAYVHVEGTRKAQEITGTSTRTLLHRDIKPSNILVEAPPELINASAAEIFRHPQTQALLIDFGSARMFREVEQDDVSRSIGVVTEGYAPPELKDNDLDQQGPHSDIYSLAAVVWRAFIGRKPTSAQLANGARLADLALPVRDENGVEKPRASKRFLTAVDQALNAAVGARPQSVAAWKEDLFGPEKQKPEKKQKKATDGAAKSGQDKDKAGKKKLHPLAWVGLGVVATIGVLVWLGLDNTESHIREQANQAYADAERVSSIASVVADQAEEQAKTGRVQLDPAVSSAIAGSEKYDRFVATQTPIRVYHGGNSGSAAFGDTQRYFAPEDVYWWCFKKNDRVVPDRTYSYYKYPDLQVDGQGGWACGIPHTHVIPQEFTEARNPWRLTPGAYAYNGEVNGEKAAGLGQMVFRDSTFTGRFEGDDNRYAVTGALKDNEGRFLAGRFVMTVKPKTGLVSWTGEEQQNGMVFRGKTTDGLHAGLFPVSTGRFIGGGANGLLIGRMTLTDGTVWYGAMASPKVGGNIEGDTNLATAATRAWGRLSSSGGVYYGQMTNGKPDGCGLWERNGETEVGYYEGDYRQTGDALRGCKKAKYERPIDAGLFSTFANADAAPGAAQ